MKIKSYETFLIPPRWLFLRIDTDEGISGWGEPIVEGRAGTTAIAVGELMEHLIGTDPRPIEDHWQVLAKGGFFRGGPVLSSALAGIDQALWDIKGKALGVPIYELLGGPVRQRVQVYAWIGGDSTAELVDDATGRIEAGFEALKCNASAQLRHLDTAAATRAVANRIDALRSAIGDQVDVMVDFHGRMSLPMSRRILPLLEPLLPLFIEEPVTPEYSRDLAKVSASTSIPIATGERLYSRWDFRDVLPAIAVAQPDPSHAGGISEVRRIAAMAEVYDVSVAPHCPLGPITLAACLQIDFATPNFLIQEQCLDLHQRQGYDPFVYLANPDVLRPINGYLTRPTGPGLGIEIDEAVVREAAKAGHRWRYPLVRHSDGAHAEW